MRLLLIIKNCIMTKTEVIKNYCKQLKLSAISNELDMMITDAQNNKSSYLELVKNLFEAEITRRVEMNKQNRTRQAKLPLSYNLDLLSSGGARGEIQLRVLVDDVLIHPQGSVSCYLRNSGSAIKAAPSGSVLIRTTSLNSVIKIQYQRTDSDASMTIADESNAVSSLRILKLSDASNYADILTNTSTLLNTHNTFVSCGAKPPPTRICDHRCHLLSQRFCAIPKGPRCR